MSVKYPDIEVQLSGTDGNAFAIIGSVSRAMRRAGVDAAEIGAYTDESMSSDYDSLLRVACEWVTVS